MTSEADSGVDRPRVATALQRSVGALSTAATGRMEAQVGWFRDLPARERAWVGQIIQAGVRDFVAWYPDQHTSTPAKPEAPDALAASIFGVAPQELTGLITLRQTVDLVRLCLDVVEGHLEQIVHPHDLNDIHEAILRYGREVAFATAEVYARAAESRGAWDARLEALLVDGVLRADADETVQSRASALGWRERGDVTVVLGDLPAGGGGTDLFDDVRRVASAADLDALCGGHGDRMVVVLGGVTDPTAAATLVADYFGPGPVVLGPVVRGLGQAHVAARAAIAAHRAATGWPQAPRPVSSGDLLPERALAGDGHARRHLVDEVYAPLAEARGDLLGTLTVYFHHGGTIEAAARELIVHANTVRYRLRQVTQLTGLDPTQARHAFALRIALVLGRQNRTSG